jgi:hypothetical protein
MTFADPPHDSYRIKFTTQNWSHPCALESVLWGERRFQV